MCLPGMNSKDRLLVLGLSAATNFNRLGIKLLFAKHYFWQASVTKPNALHITHSISLY